MESHSIDWGYTHEELLLELDDDDEDDEDDCTRALLKKITKSHGI